MLLFYAPYILTDPVLPEVESGHCVRVLRKQAGDEIDITDGKGHFFRAVITEPHPKKCRVEIRETTQPEPIWPGSIEIALAPTKNMDRVEWFAEKATEIGIDRISFLKTRYSERKEIKLERVEKILVSAMKQSEKASLPELQGMTDIKAFLKQGFDGRKFIAHCYPEKKVLLSQTYQPGERALVLIGPEGDFSEEEVALALAEGFEPISLGDSRLRTETAALVACHTFHVINQLPK
ncbi:16S rRNA (uracil(1498)-N(3))-methyltransferase [Bacteroidales bacterium OttesenSCG-928-L03]|nr:16S rRNA (uracil(1498)-N(3))-methyltransferase [Bacteroidales bacterium OttesenSCG-928-L03]